MFVAKKCRIESCPHVNRSRYDWQPATTCRSVSGARHFKQSEVGDKSHLVKFSRVSRELLMYRTLKLNMFFGQIYQIVVVPKKDQILVSWKKENFVMLVEKEPRQVN